MKSAKFEEQFVKNLIKQKEGNKLDFKQKITSKEKISKTLAGMANSDGGFILIGISDDKRIIGVDPEEERYMIEAANEEFCIPKVSLAINEIKVFDEKMSDLTEENEKSLLLVEVKKTQGPEIFCKGKNGELKSYRRVNDQTLST
ncbi:AlbA family DNA-binding domain-containing protein [Algoriphagus terrigena]|uniref:AlbA family DNA-binding domain-containing protein n=1 Tax=Algoriphagus terrigena TaxID=344884 RepID=UPI000407F698|nr:ATP-binding protein [Algoriphagus terrigena]